MGYYSSFDVNIPTIDFSDRPIPLKVWKEFESTECFKNINYFINIVPFIDFEKRLGQEEQEKFVTELEFVRGESGKAYDFDKDLPEFINMFKNIVGVSFSGEVIRYGEENTDIEKYVINDNGTVHVFKVKVVFSETPDKTL